MLERGNFGSLVYEIIMDLVGSHIYCIREFGRQAVYEIIVHSVRVRRSCKTLEDKSTKLYD